MGSVVALIPARGGSKGVPGKNIKSLNGKPLIAFTIEASLRSKLINRTIVSTDRDDIAQISLDFGAEVPFIRPADLARDDSPEWLAWRHALNYLLETTGALPEVMVSVPTTAPLRLPLDIENCLDEFEKGDADVVITVTDAHRSPYYNMLKTNADGTVGLVNPPQSAITRRQDAPLDYDMVTVCYVFNPEFVMTHNATFEGRVKAIQVPPERAIDIDTLLDFQIAENLLNIRDQNL